MQTEPKSSNMKTNPDHFFAPAFWCIGIALCLACPIHAQVPQLLNYQGRVQVGTNDFTGTGQFKFALVNTSGSQTFWSNDGTAPGEPAAAVNLPVSKGLYSVLLGDATLANMTVLSAQVFTNADVRLRIWFNDGTNGFQQFVPDQRIAAVGYAIMAGNVPDGTITSAKLAAGAVNSTRLADGAITTAKLANNAVTTVQLADSAVISAKIAPGAVDASKLAPGAISRLSNPSGSISDAVQVDNAGRVGVGTIKPQQQLSVAGGMVIDQAGANNSTLTNGLRFGSNSGEGIASKRTDTGNKWGLDFYTGNQPQMTIGNNGNVGIGTGTAQPRTKMDIRSPDAAIELRNSNDQGRGGLIENTFEALQLGMFAESNGQGQVPAAGKRAFFGFDTGGRVGSLTNSLNSPSAPGYRNLLDDGQGNAVITGNLSVGNLSVENLPGIEFQQISDPLADPFENHLEVAPNQYADLDSVTVEIPRSGFIVLMGTALLKAVSPAPGSVAGLSVEIFDETGNQVISRDEYISAGNAMNCAFMCVFPAPAGTRVFKTKVKMHDGGGDVFPNQHKLIAGYFPVRY